MKKITVLGAGSTGHAIAADLTLAGFEVTLYEQPGFNEERVETILTQGGIEIRGAARQGFAKISRVTTEMEEALKDTSVVMVAVLASRHEKIAELCAPYLSEGQTIVISAGNAGSLIFANKLKEERVTIAEIEGNLYPCRIVAPATVLVALPTRTKYVAAFPAKNTERARDALRGIYDTLPATNVLEAALNSPNVVIHLAASLLNTGAIEQSGGEYYLYKQGMTESALRCIEAMNSEKLALFKALGYVERSPLELIKKVAKQAEFPELAAFRGLMGPTSMRHRYISEDASMGVSLMVSLGEMINVAVPMAKALVTLASVVNQIDYLKEGRTVEKLGIAGSTINELNEFLVKGERG